MRGVMTDIGLSEIDINAHTLPLKFFFSFY
jgi:hypothetical protein